MFISSVDLLCRTKSSVCVVRCAGWGANVGSEGKTCHRDKGVGQASHSQHITQRQCSDEYISHRYNVTERHVW